MTLAQAIPVVIGVLMIFAVSFSMFRLHRSRSRPDRDGFSESGAGHNGERQSDEGSGGSDPGAGGD